MPFRPMPFKPAALAISAILTAGLPLAAQAQDTIGPAAAAEVMNGDGTSIGTVYLRSTASGIVTVTLALTDLPEGGHGVHLHETGDCSADDFSSAGGHLAGDAAHGVLAADGPHPGDLPNVIVQDDGVVNIEYFASGLDIAEMVLDDDGSAFIVHENADDYTSQPSGDAGGRIACGVFEMAQNTVETDG